MKTCEVCGRETTHPGNRFCYHHQGLMMKQMRKSKYLTPMVYQTQDGKVDLRKWPPPAIPNSESVSLSNES